MIRKKLMSHVCFAHILDYLLSLQKYEVLVVCFIYAILFEKDPFYSCTRSFVLSIT